MAIVKQLPTAVTWI